MRTGYALIREERDRQQLSRLDGGEGYDANHDRGHADELSLAGACYAIPAEFRPKQPHSILPQPSLWPWHADHWKPDTTGDREGRIRELTKAGALIAAAIDALIDDIERGGQ